MAWTEHKRPKTKAYWNLPESTKKLAYKAKVSLELVEAIVERRIDPYIDFKIAKRGRGTRGISAPIQAFVPALQHILINLPQDQIHPAAFAYVSRKSVADCARMHEGMKWGIKVDIKAFFDSIDEGMVKRALRDAGANLDRAKLVATLATRLPVSGSELGKSRVKRLSERIPSWLGGVRRPLGYLPQGSHTSGYLANLVAYKLDCDLTQIAAKNNLVYTRYSDDIVMSSRESNFDRAVALSVISLIRQRANVSGFSLNEAKTRVLAPGSKKVMLGLLVDAPGVRLTREKKTAMNNLFYVLHKFGTYNYLVKESNGSLEANSEELAHAAYGLYNRIWGNIAYVFDVDKVFADHILHQFASLCMTDEFLRSLGAEDSFVNSITRLQARIANEL